MARDNGRGLFLTERGAASGILAANLVLDLPQSVMAMIVTIAACEIPLMCRS
ncbi:hypothetical protein X769_22405 [Mesorhizobium sp. LSJC268A00]|nr:hypothetical protein X769_22405 [Mesorhizobium sp. LSJC268A00]